MTESRHGPPSVDGTTTTRALLRRGRAGDQAALERVFLRAYGDLRRWASGRLPRWARGLADTTDLIQDVFARTFRRLDRFEPRRRKALEAYLRQAVRNRIRDEIRRHSRHQGHEPLDDVEAVGGPSPLPELIAVENLARYREALARLRPEEQEMIVARLELGFSYEQLALATGRPSPDAARMAVKRAMLHLAEVMGSG